MKLVFCGHPLEHDFNEQKIKAVERLRQTQLDRGTYVRLKIEEKEQCGRHFAIGRGKTTRHKISTLAFITLSENDGLTAIWPMTVAIHRKYSRHLRCADQELAAFIVLQLHSSSSEFFTNEVKFARSK